MRPPKKKQPKELCRVLGRVDVDVDLHLDLNPVNDCENKIETKEHNPSYNCLNE